jgi:hypothetical protein
MEYVYKYWSEFHMIQKRSRHVNMLALLILGNWKMKVYEICLSTTDHLDLHHVWYPVAHSLINPQDNSCKPALPITIQSWHMHIHTCTRATHIINQYIKVAVKIPVFLPVTYIFVFVWHGYSNGLLCLFWFHYELWINILGELFT